jgi:hypothetical protein
MAFDAREGILLIEPAQADLAPLELGLAQGAAQIGGKEALLFGGVGQRQVLAVGSAADHRQRGDPYRLALGLAVPFVHLLGQQAVRGIAADRDRRMR